MRKMVLAALAASIFCGSANAALFTTSFGSLVPGYGPNDDNVYTVTLPFAFTYFGSVYTTAVVSNNGNVQFGTSSGAYSPDPLNTSTTVRGIAPYWTDLDSRNDPLGAIAAQTGGSAVYYSTPTLDQAVFTWDRLGYYSTDYGNRVQFQLVLNNPNDPIASGQSEIGFYYGPVGPQSTNTSRAVTIGFGDGQSAVNQGEISLFAGNSGDAANFINSGPGQYLFNQQSGVITIAPGMVPEPASWAMMVAGFGLVGAAIRRRKVAVSFA